MGRRGAGPPRGVQRDVEGQRAWGQGHGWAFLSAPGAGQLAVRSRLGGLICTVLSRSPVSPQRASTFPYRPLSMTSRGPLHSPAYTASCPPPTHGVPPPRPRCRTAPRSRPGDRRTPPAAGHPSDDPAHHRRRPARPSPAGRTHPRVPHPYGKPVDLSREYPAEEFAPPGGAFLLLLEDGRPVAGGAYRRHDARTAELKRIWTHSAHRRRGLARRVLDALERDAAARGPSTGCATR